MKSRKNSYMTTYADRFRYALQLRDMSISDLARAMKVSPQSISQVLNGSTKSLTAANALAAATALNVPVEWLVLGTGTRPTREEADDSVSLQATTFGGDDGYYVEVVNAVGSMGRGRSQPDVEQVVSVMHLTMSWIRSALPQISAVANLAIMTAQGDSMTPTFMDGDLVLIDRGIHDIKSDAVYALAIDDDLFIKRVQRGLVDGNLTIRSDNQLYAPIEVKGEEATRLKVLGRVVWSWTGRRM